MARPKVWFVTGASSGIGLCVTEHILKRGDIVVATLRTPSTLSTFIEQYPTSQLLILKCDVIDYDEVKDAFAQAIKAFKRIDVVFNNAGIGFLGEAEGTPEDFARQMFDVNFWAAANISREAVRIFRETNGEDLDGGGSGGRLLNVSSTAGIVSGACYTYYSASKYALEGFTEGLQKEIEPKWNILISIIELGPFRTRGFSHSVKLPVHPAYADPDSIVQQARAILTSETRRSPADPQRAAERIYDFTNVEKPPLRLVLGDNSPNYVIQKLDKVKEEVEAYKKWSEGLKATNNEKMS